VPEVERVECAGLAISVAQHQFLVGNGLLHAASSVTRRSGKGAVVTPVALASLT
jgi:hypothetical protein